MALTYEYGTLNYKSYQYYGCYGDASGFRTVNLNTGRKTVHVVQSRPRPDNLLDSLTPLAKQYTWVNGWCIYKIPGGSGTCTWDTWGHFDCTFIPSLPFSTDWALRLRLKIKSESLNLGSYLAEYRENTKLFGGLVDKLKQAWQCGKKLKKGRKCSSRRKPFKTRGKGKCPKGYVKTFSKGVVWCKPISRRAPLTTKDASSVALMQDFLIMPAARDLEEGLQRMNSKYGGRAHVKRFSVSAKEKLVEETSSSLAHRELSERATAYITFNTDISEFQAGNLLENVWEGTFLSFVVDWVIPIGDYLSSLDALKDVSSMRGVVTTKESAYFEPKDKYAGVYPVVASSNGHFEAFSRVVIDDIPLPSIPTYNPSSSLKNLWQGLNLLNVIRKDLS